jgi:hypothetical protein
MCTTTRFYICPTCFAATETEPIGHSHAMICIDLSSLQPDSQCPPLNGDGTLQTRRPGWFSTATQQAQRQLQTVYNRA